MKRLIFHAGTDKAAFECPVQQLFGQLEWKLLEVNKIDGMGDDIPRLAVDPRNPDVCYAAALGHLWGANKERGIFKTTDGGSTWASLAITATNTDFYYVNKIVVSKVNSQRVYAADVSAREDADVSQLEWGLSFFTNQPQRS